MHIRYKPRVNLGSLVVTRESIDYATRYYAPPPTLLQPIQPPPVISVPISPPPSFYDPPSIVAPGYFDPSPPQYDPVTGMQLPGTGFTAPGTTPFMPTFDTALPEQFVYSKEQIMDMLARGASETFERTGETDSGLPIDTELEQKSRELDATKNYVINASGEIVPVEPKAAGGGLALLAATVAAFFLFGG